MSIDRDGIEKIAALAKLQFDEADLQTYTSGLSDILGLIEQMNQADTTGITPMAHPLTEMTQRLRPDVVTKTDQRTNFQSIAPSVESGLYLVPTVISDGEE